MNFFSIGLAFCNCKKIVGDIDVKGVDNCGPGYLDHGADRSNRDSALRS